MTSQLTIDLLPVDDDVLERLLAVAVADALPGEALPAEAPAATGPVWTEPRKEAFRAYHRGCRVSLEAPVPEVTWAVAADGRIAGAARLALVDDDPAAREVGLWLGRSHRGRGIAGEVAYWAMAAARTMDARRLVAGASPDDAAARRALERIGFELEHRDGALVGTLTLP